MLELLLFLFSYIEADIDIIPVVAMLDGLGLRGWPDSLILTELEAAVVVDGVSPLIALGERPENLGQASISVMKARMDREAIKYVLFLMQYPFPNDEDNTVQFHEFS